MLLFALIALISVLLSKCYIKIAGRVGALDIPNQRSLHQVEIPRGAGLVIVSLTVTGWAVLEYLGIVNYIWFRSFMLIAFGIGFLGYVDDIYQISFAVKGAVQLVLSLCALYFLRDEIESLILYFSLLFWCLSIVNFYNFMDGIDGMAAIYGLILSLCWVIVGLQVKEPLFYYSGILIGASCIGVLHFNWSPASVFLGDVGSLFLGFIFSYFGVILALRHPEMASMSILILWAFIFDCTYTLIKRFLSGEKIWQAHREHLYQRLVCAGYSHSFVSTLYGMISIVGFGAWYMHDYLLIPIAFVIGSAVSMLLLVRLAESDSEHVLSS